MAYLTLEEQTWQGARAPVAAIITSPLIILGALLWFSDWLNRPRADVSNWKYVCTHYAAFRTPKGTCSRCGEPIPVGSVPNLYVKSLP